MFAPSRLSIGARIATLRPRARVGSVNTCVRWPSVPHPLWSEDLVDRELTNKIVRSWLSRAHRAAGIEVTRAIHRLLHPFCSMLGAEGAPPLAVQRAGWARPHIDGDELHAPVPDDARRGHRSS